MLLLLGLVLGVRDAAAQQPPVPPPPTPASAEMQLRPTYVLGPNDQILIRVPGSPEISEAPYRIDETGEITLPLAGRVRAADLTVAQLEEEIAKRLRAYLVDPQVAISVVQFRSEPVFVVGHFVRPGIHPLQGRRTLLDTLSALGGLLPNASRRIRVTRRLEYGKIPLPAAVENLADEVSTVEIHLNRLMETINPAEDLVLQPFDVVSAQRLEPVYVNGEVIRPGPFETQEGESISLLKVLSLAGGLSPNADHKGLRILRLVEGTNRRAEIRISLDDAIAGRGNDFPILPNDVLYVPRKASFMSGFNRTLLTVAPALASAIIIVLIR